MGIRLSPPRRGLGQPGSEATLWPHSLPGQFESLTLFMPNNKAPMKGALLFGGELGIRTLGGFTLTAFRVLHLRPLGQLSRIWASLKECPYIIRQMQADCQVWLFLHLCSHRDDLHRAADELGHRLGLERLAGELGQIVELAG